MLVAPNGAWAAQGAGETGPDQIAVLPLEIVGEIPAGRPALEAAVLRGLTISSVQAMEPSERDSRLKKATVQLPCDKAECWSALGRDLQARYLLTGSVERRGPLFSVEFRLVDARMGRILATQSNRCETSDCSVAELCRLVVREMARQTLNQGPEQPSALPLPAAAAPAEQLVPPVSASPAVSETAPGADPPPLSPALRRWAIPAIVGGVVVAAGGGFLLWLDKQCAKRYPPPGDPECQELWGSDYKETLIGGYGGLGLGAALVTTGIALLVSDGEGSDAGASGGVNLSLTPAGFALSGRF
jgi:hypothetical protein